MTPFLSQESSYLRENGAIFEVVVKPSSPKVDLLQLEKKDIPFLKVSALIDTGAQTTAVSENIIQSLSLTVRGTVRVHTSGGPETELRNEYDICIEFDTDKYIDLLRVISASLEDQSFDCIIGRDILDRCTFIYDGPSQKFALSFGEDRVLIEDILNKPRKRK